MSLDVDFKAGRVMIPMSLDQSELAAVVYGSCKISSDISSGIIPRPESSAAVKDTGPSVFLVTRDRRRFENP